MPPPLEERHGEREEEKRRNGLRGK